MSPESIPLVIAAFSVLTNIVVGVIGWLAKTALASLQSKLDAFVASQIATEKAVAVLEVRHGGEISQLRAELTQSRSELAQLRAVVQQIQSAA